jgi:putative NADH-flavin reductase
VRIAVFGATGRTGRHILAEGIRRGHEMVASTRHPGVLVETELAAVVPGDAREPKTVCQAIDGTDVVISIISGGSRRDPHRAADATRAITAAMSELAVRRLVVTSAYPIVAETPRLAIALLRLLLATPYADVAAMEQVVWSSGLDWTIARLNRLTDRAATGNVCISRELLARPRSITRADAAATLLDIAQNGTLARTSINVCGG